MGIEANINQPGTVGSGGVTKITAGTNITISPPGGTGNVTINSTGGGGSPSIGGTVTGGLDKSVLFIDPAGVLAQDNPHFIYDNGTLTFQAQNIASPVFTDGGLTYGKNIYGVYQALKCAPSQLFWEDGTNQLAVGPDHNFGPEKARISGDYQYNGDTPSGATGTIFYGQTSGYPTGGYTNTVNIYSANSATGPLSQTFTTATVTDNGQQLFSGDATGAGVSQDLAGSGYIANGQTFTYYVFAYNDYPSGRAYSSTPSTTAYTDTINDGTTPFSNDVTWSMGGGNPISGYFLVYTPDGGNWYNQDVGNVTNFTDMNSGWNFMGAFAAPTPTSTPDFYLIQWNWVDSAGAVTNYFVFNQSNYLGSNFDIYELFIEPTTVFNDDGASAYSGTGTVSQFNSYLQSIEALGDIDVGFGNINLTGTNGSLIGNGGEVIGLTWEGSVIAVNYGGTGNSTGFATNGVTYFNGSIIKSDTGFTYNGSGQIRLGTGSGGSKGELTLQGLSSGNITLVPTNNVTGSWSWGLPAVGSTIGQLMEGIDSSGNTIWSNTILSSKTIIDTGTIGAEKITNGTFTGSATGWTLGIGWAYSSNQVSFGGGTAGTLSQTSAAMVTPLVIGQWYQLSYNISGTNGSVTPSVAGVTLPQVNTVASVVTLPFKAISTASLVFTPVVGANINIDNVSLKQVQGGDLVVLNSMSTNTLNLGIAGSNLGVATLSGNTSGTVTVQPAAVAGTWSLTLPTTGGTNKYALTTNGSGVSTWSQIDLTAGVTGALPVANGGTGQTTPVVVANSFSGTGTATTAFTVTIGTTQANNTYKVVIEPTNLLAAAVQYISAKTTTTFTVTYLAGLTGTVTFDWALFT